ncbi:protein kinase domain-containing protein [Pelagibaculum spongiae]|nr:protein kinase [Pelagibaculum spongiae]
MNAKTDQKKRKKTGNRDAIDNLGQRYRLTGALGEGGQGKVCLTNFPNVLVKVRTSKNLEQNKEWLRHVKWLMRQDLEQLQIARPVSIIKKPKSVFGYVLQLMDGLEPIKEMIEKTHISLCEDGSMEGFSATGGLKRRVYLLKELAKNLNKLHSRGMAYGDLSLENIFISQSADDHQVWLIDCDNICFSEREGHGHIHTPGYAAPEVVRQESGVNIATDCWSFAVIAMQLLTDNHPFTSSFFCDDAEDTERVLEQAHSGELPWIYDESDDSNCWDESGIPLELVTNNKTFTLFERCFSTGKNQPYQRPSMAEWQDILDQSYSRLVICENSQDCGSHYFYNDKHVCDFCDSEQVLNHSLKLDYFFYNDEFDKNEDPETSPWINTDYSQLVNLDQTIDLHLNPAGSEHYHESPRLCSIELTAKALRILPQNKSKVLMIRSSDQKTLEIKRQASLKQEVKKGEQFELHIWYCDSTNRPAHIVWKFTW